MNFKKEILVPFRKILVPFRTTVPKTVILAGHFSWFGTCVLSTEILTWTALWGHSVSALMVQWKILACDAGGPKFKYVYNFFIMTSLRA
jgi:hypothetical protein